MYFIVFNALLLLAAGWFWLKCIYRPPKTPPRAWLSLVPPIIEYGKDPVSFLRRARARYGDTFTIPGPLEMTFIFDNHAMRTIFDAPDSQISFLKGVAVAVGHIFGPLLKTSTPYEPLMNAMIFKGLHQANALNGYRAFLNADADEELARLATLPSLDVFTEMGRVIVRLSVRMLFGSFIDRSAYRQVCDNWPVMERLAFHPLTLIATRLPLGPPAEFQRKRAELFALISGALTKAFATKDTNDDSYLGMIVRENRNDFPPESRDYLMLHLCSIMFGAHTNSSAAIAWLIARLTENPEALEKVIEEQKQVEAEFGDSYSADAVTKMVYLDACLRETVRQVAPLSMIRYTQQPFPVGSLVIPSNSLIVISPKLIHDDPNIWPQSDTWDPANFFNAPPRPAAQFIGFGAGIHRCKGERIVMYEGKIMIAKIVRKYRLARLSPDARTPLPPNYAQPSAGIPFPGARLLVRLEPLVAPTSTASSS